MEKLLNKYLSSNVICYLVRLVILPKSYKQKPLKTWCQSVAKRTNKICYNTLEENIIKKLGLMS